MTITDNPIDMEALRAFIAAADKAPAVPDEILAQARELDDLRSALKTLDKRQKVLRASLLDFLSIEGVDSVTDGKVSIARSEHVRKGVDRKRMEALYPKVLADCATEISVEQVRVTVTV